MCGITLGLADPKNVFLLFAIATVYANLNRFLCGCTIDIDQTMYASQAVTPSLHTLGKEKK